MRIIIIEATPLGLDLAEKSINSGYEVILIEKNPKVAKDLSETLDCTVINAEGTRPDILEKAEIEKADAVVACTNHDQDNIIIGLIARDFGVPEIIIKTEDLQLMTVAKRLGFHHVVNPPEITSTIILHALRGIDTIELSTLIRGDVRLISVIAGKKVEGTNISEIALPKKSGYIGLYRGTDFIFYSENPRLLQGDEIMIVTLVEHIDEIDKIFLEENGEEDHP
ncbi:TrkA family potassium uptake protein [Methanoplanus sp. FWC-SCC4]|uniref:TrkA family potassium uptake protein n=1 Tax=Methanochimaera problematica TaxID=2609417 RepID=A0AA97FCE7_9EURY|nr:TrkA family potassium uptake protein [Methanoplanus sp. FWC-SCC4]WOF16389.1 TrkA family potassium uptake protein [Methanoplanus sp. FWC-SCC4]